MWQLPCMAPTIVRKCGHSGVSEMKILRKLGMAERSFGLISITPRDKDGNPWKGKLDKMVAKLQNKGFASTPYEDA